jgi:MFS family permease
MTPSTEPPKPCLANQSAAATPIWLRVAFGLVGLGFVGAGLYHAVAVVFPDIAEPSPSWRHALFVAINGLVGVGLLRRPPWFAWLLTVLTLQQVYSHGAYGWQVWRAEGRIDWASALVLVALPPLTALVWWDVRRRRRVREPRRGT